MHRLPRLRAALPTKPSPLPRRAFTLFPPTPTRPHRNRIFDPIRAPQDLHTLLLLCASASRPLVTLWSTSYCASCLSIKPLLVRLLETEKVGEAEGGLGFAEVQMDSALIGDLPVTYRVTSIPMLMAFSRQEAMFDSVVREVGDMGNEKWVREWLVREAERGGRKGGGGGGLFGW